MSDINFNKTRFIKVAVTPNDLPDNKLPEIVLSFTEQLVMVRTLPDPIEE